MNVGLVTYGSLTQLSGGYRYNRKLVESLRERGDRVTVISLPPRSGGRALVDNLSRRVRRQLDQPFDVLLQDELCYRSLIRHTEQLSRPDRVIALVHLLELPGAAGRVHRLASAVERRYLSGVDGCVATSRHTARQITAVTDTETVVAYPAGRHETGAVDEDHVVERAESGPLHVTFVGSLVERKGLHTLIDALGRLETAWTATVVGEPTSDSYERCVRSHIAELPDGDAVTLAGRVSRERLSTVLSRSDVLAVPSAYESFGMAYLEAMEYGVVPIASSVGGAGEFVDHGVNGFLVAPDSPDVLARQLATLGSDRDRLAAMGTAALETARDHPSWAESMGRLRSFLEGARRQSPGAETEINGR